jgi:hypothetical protein
MKVKNCQDAYLQHLLASVERKRRFSIENAYKTDLYTNDELLEFMNWFDELIRLVKDTPPNGYVRAVNIIENKDGRILSIRYDLFDKQEIIKDVELIIIHDS